MAALFAISSIFLTIVVRLFVFSFSNKCSNNVHSPEPLILVLNKTEIALKLTSLAATINLGGRGNSVFGRREVTRIPTGDIEIYCSSRKPVQWIANEGHLDPTEEGEPYVKFATYIEAETDTYKPTTYYAIMSVTNTDRNFSEVVSICEEIENTCNAQIILLTYQHSGSYQVHNFNRSDIHAHASVSKFIDKRNSTDSLLKVDKQVCHMTLTLTWADSVLHYDWHNFSNTARPVLLPLSVQSRDNLYRFTPKLDSECITFSDAHFFSPAGSKCKSCQSYAPPGRYPILTLYNEGNNGEGRVVHLGFDLGYEKPYLMGDYPTQSYLFGIRASGSPFVAENKIYLECHASPAKFAFGSVVYWGLPGEHPYEVIQTSRYTFDSYYGVYLSQVEITIPLEILQRNPSTLNVTCAFFEWNTTRTFSDSEQFFLKDFENLGVSVFDEIRDIEIKNGSQMDINTGGEVNISCSGRGTPLPDVQFYFFKKNATLNISGLLSRYPATARLLITNINTSSQGIYSCVAQSQFGVESVMFEVNVFAGTQEVSDNENFLSESVIAGIAGSVLITLILVSSLIRKIIRQTTNQILSENDMKQFIEGNTDVTIFPEYECLPYQTDKEINPTNFQLNNGCILGSGTYGMVVRATVNGIAVAAKTVKQNMDRDCLMSLISEIKIMSYLDVHPNLVKFIGACTKNIQRGQVIVFLELCPMGSVESYIRKLKCVSTTLQPDVTNNQPSLLAKASYVNRLTKWSLQVANGMQYLSEKKVVHGDLASRNLLLRDLNTIKISDFGLSRQLRNCEVYKETKNQRLPWRHMPPETLFGKQFSVKSDVWAFGVTLWEMFSEGDVPYTEFQWCDGFISSLENGLQLAKPAYCSLEMFSLMQNCWKLNPEERPQFKILYKRIEQISLIEDYGAQHKTDYRPSEQAYKNSIDRVVKIVTNSGTKVTYEDFQNLEAKLIEQIKTVHGSVKIRIQRVTFENGQTLVHCVDDTTQRWVESTIINWDLGKFMISNGADKHICVCLPITDREEFDYTQFVQTLEEQNDIDASNWRLVKLVQRTGWKINHKTGYLVVIEMKKEDFELIQNQTLYYLLNEITPKEWNPGSPVETYV